MRGAKMKRNVSNRVFPVEIRVRVAAFARRLDASVQLIATEDGKSFHVGARPRDYCHLIEAADAIEATYTAEQAWLAGYLTDPDCPPCEVDCFNAPLARELDRISADHFAASGRAGKWRRDCERRTRELKRVRRAAAGSARIPLMSKPVQVSACR